jgi:hypothetical protein
MTGVMGIQYVIDKTDRLTPQEEFQYLPSGKFIKGAALSYDEMVADLLWIRLIGYFADHSKTDRDYAWMEHFLSIITELDPLFQYVYEFGGIILSAEMNRPEKSNRLLLKGMKVVPESHPRYWRFPFLIAFNYMFYLNDNGAASRFMTQAARFEGAPQYLPLLASKLLARSDYHENAIRFLTEIIQDARSEELKERLNKRILEIKNDKIIQVLEKAQEFFFSDRGHYPLLVQELVLYGYLPGIYNPDPQGAYYIDIQDHTIFHSTLGGQLKIHLSDEMQNIRMKEIK